MLSIDMYFNHIFENDISYHKLKFQIKWKYV